MNAFNRVYQLTSLSCFYPCMHGHIGMVRNNVGTVLRHLVPVHHVPKVAYVFRSAVLIFEVVGVFPYIESQNGEHDFVGSTIALHERIVLVGRTDQLEFVALTNTGRNASGKPAYLLSSYRLNLL
jgi:hypothetical protein